MATSFEEFVEFRKLNPVPPRRQNPEQLREFQAVGGAMAGLISDPRWKVYLDYVEGQKLKYQQLIDRAKQSLEGAFLDPKEYGQLKVDLATYKGVLDGLNFCINFVTTLIQRGEDAAKELTNIDKA